MGHFGQMKLKDRDTALSGLCSLGAVEPEDISSGCVKENFYTAFVLVRDYINQPNWEDCIAAIRKERDSCYDKFCELVSVRGKEDEAQRFLCRRDMLDALIEKLLGDMESR